MARKFEVYEDNGGGLTLIVYADGSETEIAYVHDGYEYYPGMLREDLEALKSGAEPEIEWDNNMLDPTCNADYEQILESFRESGKDPHDIETWFPTEDRVLGWDLIADNDGLYPEEMGSSGYYEFEIEHK